MAKSAKRTSKKAPRAGIQPYPRIHDPEGDFDDFLDDSKLVQHSIKLPIEQVKTFIRRAINDANKKSSRVILAISADESQEALDKKYKKEGKKLLQYFKRYCVDPAATAHQIKGKHYGEVGRDLFLRRSLQKERMNSGWRYQYLTTYCARATGRFENVSDITPKEADFHAEIAFLNDSEQVLNIFVSVKNRKDTIGGQDFPKAVQALEKAIMTQMSRKGPYICVFGIAMDRGARQIRRDNDNRPYSVNTEVWLSDYFWPFFTNYSYEEIMTLVLEVLEQLSEDNSLTTEVYVPEELLVSFGIACRETGLVDEQGYFDDARKVVSFICSTQRAPSKKTKEV